MMRSNSPTSSPARGAGAGALPRTIDKQRPHHRVVRIVPGQVGVHIDQGSAFPAPSATSGVSVCSIDVRSDVLELTPRAPTHVARPGWDRGAKTRRLRSWCSTCSGEGGGPGWKETGDGAAGLLLPPRCQASLANVRHLVFQEPAETALIGSPGCGSSARRLIAKFATFHHGRVLHAGLPTWFCTAKTGR